MSTDVSSTVDVESELFLGLEVDDMEEMPCESGWHPIEPLFHEGPGEWYVSWKCIVCPERYDLGLMCDKYVKSVLQVGGLCDKCGTHDEKAEGFIVKGRRE